MSHIRAAISEGGVKEILAGLIENFTFEDSGSTDGDTFTFGYEVELHLGGGDVELKDEGTILLDEIDIIWDKLVGSLSIDFDEICVGGQCIPTPFGDICLPEFCIFDEDPDLVLELDLAPIIHRSEISGEFEPDIRFFVNPDRPADMDYIEAQAPISDDDDSNLADKWRVHIKPIQLDADPIDFADVVADLVEAAFLQVLNNELSFLPGPVRDVILAIVGVVTDFLRVALDIVDDIDEFFSDLFNVSIGIIDLILTAVARYFADDNHLFEFDNPLQILEAVEEDPNDPDVVPLIPVKIPIEKLAAVVNDDELILTADIGADL